MPAPPNDLDLERALLGACLLDPDRIPAVAQILAPTDLYSPAHQQILDACYTEHDAGHHVTPTTIAPLLTITDPAVVLGDCIDACGALSAAATYAVKIADLAALRRIQTLLGDTLETIREGHAADPATIIDTVTAGLATIDLATDTRTIDGLWTAEQMMASDFPEPPPVVPGFLSREDRLMVVGLEGRGKSVLLRGWAAMVAAGVHPLDPGRSIEPQTSLLVDLENPERVIRAGLRAMKCQPDNMHILARPGGMNLRSRRDRSLLHRVCERVQPRLVTIGPLYKMHRPERGENDEDAAVALQAVLDELRIRFGCALLIEHHAPKGSDIFRKLVPFGSSAWMRWPEFGWQLIPYDEREKMPSEKGQALQLGTFRGDRVPIDKPHHFYRGLNWPWMPCWPDGPPRVEKF